MTDDAAATRARIVAWLAVGAVVALIILGATWYGLSAEVYHRIWRDMLDRPDGPMTFRFVLQPCMATIAAMHDGLQDARLGRAPYFWTVLHDPAERGGRLREGLFSTGRIILLGLGMDVIYQYNVLNTLYPGEAALIALLLAFVPYLLLRGPIARIAHWWRSRPHSPSSDQMKG
jgi:hypothetical protein